jgi:hypothetical protein
MKTPSPDRSYIDYWQDYGTAKKSHFGIRVWEDRCCAMTNVGSEHPNLFGKIHPLPVDLSDIAPQHSVSNVAKEHMRQHPDSDLVQVLTGQKSLRDALT